jgi:hypothetical protein
LGGQGTPGVIVVEMAELCPLGPTERTEMVYAFPLASPLTQQLMTLSDLQELPPGSAVAT